jgi:thiol-disulfide isomerase/thioredoxin
MKLKKILILLLVFVVTNSYAQSNFSFTPEKPQAGEPITITYTPSGLITNTDLALEAVGYNFTGKNGETAQEIQMKKSGQTFSGTVTTDTSSNLVFFKFSAGGQIDNNNGNGYWIQLYKDGELKKGADYSVALFYEGMGRFVEVDANFGEALKYLDKEYERFPEEKKNDLLAYLRVYSQVHKDKAPALIQKEIESALKAGLKEEEDYNTVQQLYAINRLAQQSGFIEQLKKEKFPEGKWKIEETKDKYYGEKDLATKGEMLEHIISKVDSDPKWKDQKTSLTYYETLLASAYINKNDWDGFYKTIKKYDIKGAGFASLLNNTAWKMQGKNESLEKAAEISAIAAAWAKKEWKHPTSEKPAYLTEKEWEKSREATYATYADTYAMVNYKLGNYKKGFSYAQEATLKIKEGKNTVHNNTYALLASKVLSPKKFVPQLEGFVKIGKASSEIKDILKKEYLKNHNASQAEEYMALLEKANLAELRKTMLNKKAPDFILKDLNGNKISLADLKDKVLVVDFWATWCGPCKASFPAMQKMVAKYKNDPDVKFIFVDTWERVDEKEKSASDFITANKYNFQVLMDNEDKVVEQFKVDGIPTKFVIDKNGNIQFKSVGFGGEDKLINELTSMIDLAKGSK